MKEYMKDCFKSFGVVFVYLCVLFCVMYVSVSYADLFGVRSSFLTAEKAHPRIFDWRNKYGTSLMYLSPSYSAEEKAHFRSILKNNGDTHIDLYAQARNGHLPAGELHLYDYTHELNVLNDDGLKPVLWLIPESKHGEGKAPMPTHFAFQNQMVQRHDSQVAGYVVCLECDEMFSAEQVNALVANLKSRTGKPVAVHLAPGVGGFKRDTRYYKGADFIYLQIGDHLSGDYVADSNMAVTMLKEAMTLGIPVVANEYSLLSTSEQARALGDLLCQNGAVGTGNGRNVTMCGQRKPKKKKEWYQEYEKELVVTGIAAVTLYVMLNRNEEEPTFQLDANDNGYELGLNSGGYSLRYSEDRIAATYRIEF
jgi:hypothetical protein